jgi:transposase
MEVILMEVRKYTNEYKKEAVKLAKKIGTKLAATELGVPKGTIYGWLINERTGAIDLGVGSRTPENVMSLAEEMKVLREKNKELEKENARLNKLNAFLDEASRFFASSQQK